MRPSVSVVIPTASRPAELGRCLAAVATQTLRPIEVIVVDNSPHDGRTAEIASRHEVTLVAEPRRGLCRARNAGGRAARGDIVAYLDDDSVPEPGWLAGMVTAFDDPMVMAAGGRTLPLRLKTEAERIFARLRAGAYDRPHSIVIDKATPNWFEICAFGGIGAGCNMAVRRSAFDVWSGFNERTDRGTPLIGGGEHHAFFSLVELGYKVAYSPNAVVRHPYPATMHQLRRNVARDLTASAAFFTLILVEHPRHRKETLRYLSDAFSGKRRAWRPGAGTAAPQIIRRSRRVLALMMGPLRYMQSRLG